MGDFPQFLRSMEVRSEPGMVPGREPFGVGLQKNPALSQPSMQNMRLTFASDGTAIYKPVTAGSSPFQGGSPASSASAATTGVSAAGGGGATGGGGGTGVGGGGGGGEGAGGGSAAAASADAQKGAGVGVGSGGGTTGVTTDGLPRPFSPPGFNMNIGEPLKRKRGRPRKYGPDGTMALGLSPASLATGVSPGSGGYSTSSYGTGTPASGDVVSKPKPRPMGPTKKQQLKQLALLGSVGIGFTPHVITVKAGEDVSSKIMSFSQCGPRAVCILSANGAISNVTLRQAATCGGTVTYEGRFEILSLSGSFLYSESGGQRSRTGGLSVSLAGPDGRVLGGGVAGILTAASPVQVVMGSFIVDVPRDVPRETKAPTFAESPYGPSPTGMTPMPVSPPSHGMQGVPFRSWQSGAADMRKEPKQGNPPEPTYGSKIPPVSGMAASSSPRSHGTQSESSGDPDDSPLNHSSGGCNNPGQLGMTNLPWK